GVAGRAHQGTDLLVGLLRDAHQPEHHVRCGDVGVRQGELLHGVASARSGEGQGDGARGGRARSEAYAARRPTARTARDQPFGGSRGASGFLPWTPCNDFCAPPSPTCSSGSSPASSTASTPRPPTPSAPTPS